MEDSVFKSVKEIELTKIDSDIIKNTIKPFYGTTTLAFIFSGGMVIAVDSRATSGPYIASQTVNKVIEVNKYLLGTMAGGAADCFYWEKLMGIEAKRYELHNGRRITACAASMYLSNSIYPYRRYGLSMGTMICGWDKNGPGLYYVDNDGRRLEGKLFSVGSGSTIAHGILNSEYKFDMSKDEALSLGKRAIFHAGHRDAFSGGVVNLYFMDCNGWEKIGSYDISQLYDEIMSK
ncbi:subunit beta type-5 of proteasome [Hamiltosporidium magnivora]|uniref:Proteasome subunit beta n=1 Tax=Hamiltosporidium magnivora TaxID=148818 RepID=A0A4Q9LJG2_9MICR|nr:subunit beta type-5 of proteasome [Hamiltosporidium magnivora]